MEPVIRSLREADLKEADTIFRLSFGTFLGLPDPMSFFRDTDYIGTRFRADPSLSLAVEVDGNFVGSNFIANWGSVGIFGPLTVDPDFWDKGIAKRLLDKTMEIFERMKTLDSSPSPIVLNISTFTKSTTFGLGFLPQLCQNLSSQSTQRKRAKRR